MFTTAYLLLLALGAACTVRKTESYDLLPYDLKLAFARAQAFAEYDATSKNVTSADLTESLTSGKGICADSSEVELAAFKRLVDFKVKLTIHLDAFRLSTNSGDLPIVLFDERWPAIKGVGRNGRVVLKKR